MTEVKNKTENELSSLTNEGIVDDAHNINHMQIRVDFDIISNPDKFPEEKVEAAREDLLLLYNEMLFYSSQGKKICQELDLVELPENIEEIAIDIEELIKEAKEKRTHITLDDDPEDLIELEKIPEDPNKKDRDKVNKAVWKQIEEKNNGEK